jgi:hypothetical protein
MRKPLFRAAACGKTVNYGALMRAFGLSRGRALSEMIGEVDERENAAGAPGFAAMIVRKDTGFPGGGYFCDSSLPSALRRPRSKASDPHLSESEKKYIRTKQNSIWKYYARVSRSARK